MAYHNLIMEELVTQAVAKVGGQVANMSDLHSGDPGSDYRSGHYLDWFLGSPDFQFSATLVNSQLVCLRPFGIPNNVVFNFNNLNNLFYIYLSRLLGPVSTCAINTDEGQSRLCHLFPFLRPRL